MKREARQQGTVRSFRILPQHKTRFISRFEIPPTAGFFTKVPSNATNHSNFTGNGALPRCNACHVALAPTSKSSHKAKGAQKLKPSDVVLNGRPGFRLSGLSVARMLEHLAVDDSEDEGDEEVVVGDYTVSPKGSYSFSDLFRSGDDDENGSCEGDWVINGWDEAFISEMGLQMEQHYEVEDDGDWYLVESYS